jgi:hypothetical protein
MIEDIEYLQENCEKDSAIIYVDSDERNRDFAPSSSEFSITFEQPFKNVNGIDILDAAIPTTMYNIDSYNCYNAFTIVKRPSMSEVSYMSNFEEMTTSTVFKNIFEHKVPYTHIVKVDGNLDLTTYGINTFDIVNNDDEYTDFQYFICKAYQGDYIKITVTNFKNDENMFYFEYENFTYYIPKENNENIITIIQNTNFYLKPSSNGIPNTYQIMYFEFIGTTKDVYESIINDETYIVTINNYWRASEIGNYDITSLKTQLNSDWNDTTIFFYTTTATERKQGRYRFGSPNYIIYNANKSSMYRNVGFDLYPDKSDLVNYDTVPISYNRRVFLSRFNTYNDGLYTILAPGLVNLLGERFIILRCKEIEDHLLGSYAYMSNTPGLGLFKLAASFNDITNLRFDFVNLVKKPFHPIGKLHKLTFRFETSKGELYDFKGINIQMLLTLKFLVPTQKFKFTKSTLNPNYDPNFMKYMANNKNIEYHEDSDEEEEFDKRKYIELYNNEFRKYDYSSSDDEEYDSEDSEEYVGLSSRREL